MKQNKIPQAIRLVKRIQKFEMMSEKYESSPVLDSFYEQYPCCNQTVIEGHSLDCYFHQILNSIRSYENILYKALTETKLCENEYKRYFNSDLKDSNLVNHLYGYIIKFIMTKQINNYQLLDWINLSKIISAGPKSELKERLLKEINFKIKSYNPAKAIIESLNLN